MQIQIAARGGEGSCGAEDRSADLRLQIQIAARGGEGRCRAEDRSGRLQISDCKYRLQHATERGAAEGQRPGLQIPDCKYRLQHTAERGAAETGMRCEKKTQITESVCRLQHLSLQMRSVRCHHSQFSTFTHSPDSSRESSTPPCAEPTRGPDPEAVAARESATARPNPARQSLLSAQF